MPSVNEIASQKIFSGLTCPYTGKKVTVRVVASGGSRPLFFSPDAFDPSIPVASLQELLRAASARNGVVGSVSGENLMVCPYTGDRMSVYKDAAGFSLVGGFRPACPCPDPALFAYRMRMRGGVSDLPNPCPPIKITFTEDSPATSSQTPAPKDYSLEYAENALKPILPSRIVVPVSGRKKKG